MSAGGFRWESHWESKTGAAVFFTNFFINPIQGAALFFSFSYWEFSRKKHRVSGSVRKLFSSRKRHSLDPISNFPFQHHTPLILVAFPSPDICTNVSQAIPFLSVAISQSSTSTRDEMYSSGPHFQACFFERKLFNHILEGIQLLKWGLPMDHCRSELSQIPFLNMFVVLCLFLSYEMRHPRALWPCYLRVSIEPRDWGFHLEFISTFFEHFALFSRSRGSHVLAVAYCVIVTSYPVFFPPSVPHFFCHLRYFI